MFIESIDEATRLFFSLVQKPTEFADFDVNDLQFSEDFKITVYLPHPPLDSSITPPFMEAFLEIQKHIYQLAALARKGVANANYISDDERRELDIAVAVHSGSSDMGADIREAVIKCIPQAITKMSGREIAIVVLGVVLIGATAWGANNYFSMQRDIKIEEIKSTEHITALEKLSLVNEGQQKTFESLIGALKENGEVAKKALELAASAQDALLKAASKTNESVINGVHFTRDEAKALRTSSRARAENTVVIKEVRVVDINTDDATSMFITLKDQDGDDEYKIKFADRLLEDADQQRVFTALRERQSIQVELKIKSVDGEVREVELKRVVPQDGPTTAGE